MTIVSVHKSGSCVAKPYVGDIKQCNASNAFSLGNMPIPAFQINTWTCRTIASRLFIVHTRLRVRNALLFLQL
jgi:hypothetical protein